MDRSFPIENGAQTITCGECGAKDGAGRHGGKAGGKLPPAAIARFFIARGWRIGATARKDRCPACRKPQRQPKEPPQMAADPKIVNITSPKPGASEKPPREMSREDRRLIFAKLEEVYVDEKVGYSAGWHDERVAKDMAVPRAWVELIREENFGPIKAAQNPEIVELTARIDVLEQDAARLGIDAERIKKAAESALSMAAECISTSASLARRAAELRDEVRKLTGRP